MTQPPVTGAPAVAISLKIGLPDDLKDVFNQGQPVVALLVGILRELQRINGATGGAAPAAEPVAQPTVAPTVTAK